MRQITTTKRRKTAGFTLIELGVVIVIIGILVGFILSVGGQGLQNAQIRATQSLITKLDAALTDLMDQIVNNRVDPNQAHEFLAAIPNYATGPTGNALNMITDDPRAQTIANVDNIRALIPEIWFYQSNVSDYPINCGAVPYDPLLTFGNAAYTSPYAPFALPMGNQVTPRFDPTGVTGSALTGSAGIGDAFISPTTGLIVATSPTGMFGANFGVRAGLTKNLGYLAPGYDGQDNNNNGLVDELIEGTGGDATLATQIQTRLNQHTHNTARSEMLYAVLVEGLGQYGAILNRDDFTTKEVQDTDNDGLPEFIDAWGQPLQFYLWPTGYPSDIQKGTRLYSNSAEPREQAPLDPDQQLMAPAWWASNTSSATYPLPASNSAWVFSSLFFPLYEINYSSSVAVSPGSSQIWDRQFLYPNRRAYYTKFLIVSSGPDQALGLAQIDQSLITANRANPQTTAGQILGSYLQPSNSAPSGNSITTGENWAIPLTTGQFIPPWETKPTGPGVNHDGEDDLANQTIYMPGGGIQ